MTTRLRQRHGHKLSGQEADEANGNSDASASKTVPAGEPGSKGPWSWRFAFIFLLVSRLLSARVNLIHDCDETFNYWEPLHYLLHGHGLQTWEYSAEFGLRSYLYLLLHGLVAGPATLLYGGGAKKVEAFFFLRSILAVVSSAIDASLCKALVENFGERAGVYTLVLLFGSSGSFTASTTFLPSTFSMYMTTAATALALHRRPAAATAVAAAGALLGWPFAALAAAPLVLHSLAVAPARVLAAGVGATGLVMALSIAADSAFYGRRLCSVLNLVLYNVFGGGGGRGALSTAQSPPLSTFGIWHWPSTLRSRSRSPSRQL